MQHLEKINNMEKQHRGEDKTICGFLKIIPPNNYMNFMTFIVESEIFDAETLPALNKLYDDSSFPLVPNVLWDFGVALSETSIKDKDIHTIVTCISIHSANYKGGKIAIVARTEYEFNLSKKIELFTQLKPLPITVKVFRNFIEAVMWVAT
jgi:hypothetical protein